MDEDGFTMVFSPALVDKLKGEDAEEEIPPPPAIIPPRENTYTTLRRQESSTFKEIQSMIDSFPVENTEKKKFLVLEKKQNVQSVLMNQARHHTAAPISNSLVPA